MIEGQDVFDCWVDEDGNEITADTTVTRDMICTARYRTPSVRVTFETPTGPVWRVVPMGTSFSGILPAPPALPPGHEWVAVVPGDGYEFQVREESVFWISVDVFARPIAADDYISPPFFSRLIRVPGAEETPIRVIGFETTPGNIALEATRPDVGPPPTEFATNRAWANRGIAATNASFFNSNAYGALTAFHINDGEFLKHYGNRWVDGIGMDWRIHEAELNANFADDPRGRFPLALIGFTRAGNIVFRDKIPLFSSDNNGRYMQTDSGETIYLTNFLFGVGGYSLLVDRSFNSDTTFNQVFNSHYSGYEHQANNGRRARTVIGVRNNGNVVMATFFHEPIVFDGVHGTARDRWQTPQPYGARIYDLHYIMKNEFGCTHALKLDGGGSSQVSYRENGVFKSARAEQRNPWCRIRMKTI